VDTINRLRLLLRDILENPDLEEDDRAALHAVLAMLDDPGLQQDDVIDELRTRFPELFAHIAAEEPEDEI
jgi:hypothetical protein